MKYFKNEVGQVYAFEGDGSQDNFIPKDLKRMTQAEIDAHLNPQLTSEQSLLIVKDGKVKRISELSVTTQSGKIFDADEISRGRMLSAILSAEFLGISQLEWKLADNSKVIITLEELKEAHALAIQALGQVVLQD